MFCQCWMECLGRSLQTEYAESCPRVVLGWKTFSSKSRRVTFWSSSISAGRPCRGELGLPWAALMAYAAQHSAAVSLFHRNTSIVRRASSCSSWIFDSKCSLSPAMFAIPAPHWSINHRLIQTKSQRFYDFSKWRHSSSSCAAAEKPRRFQQDLEAEHHHETQLRYIGLRGSRGAKNCWWILTFKEGAFNWVNSWLGFGKSSPFMAEVFRWVKYIIYPDLRSWNYEEDLTKIWVCKPPSYKPDKKNRKTEV